LPLEEEAPQDVVGEEGAELDAVPALERPHAGEDPVALEDVDVEVDRPLGRDTIYLDGEVVDVLAVALLKGPARRGVRGGAGANEIADVVRIDPAAHGPGLEYHAPARVSAAGEAEPDPMAGAPLSGGVARVVGERPISAASAHRPDALLDCRLHE